MYRGLRIMRILGLAIRKYANKQKSPAFAYTVNISAVKITVFRCVPFPAVLSLYFLHCTTAPITVEKCKH